MSITIKWLGHSAFLLNIADRHVLIDPFLTGNPLAAASAANVPADLILLSHAHGDHVGDTVSIAQRTGAPVVTNFEIGNWLVGQGVAPEQIVQGNTGGTYHHEVLSIKWTIAFHSASLPDGSYGGSPNGLLLTVPHEGKKLYYAGDTSLFRDMELVGEEGIDLAFLPIGDLFTMGIDDSIRAIKLIRPKVVLPMHYNTFPPIHQDAGAWANRVSSETLSQPIVIDPGSVYTLA